MQINRHIHAFWTTAICIIAALVLNACGGRLFTYKGDTVTRKNMKVTLQDGEQKGEWKTDELAVFYHYEKTSDTLKMSGNVALLAGATAFNIVKQLSVYLLFLDANGMVLDDPQIFSSGNFQDYSMLSRTFNKSLTIPQGTQSISFAYTGELFNSGTGGQTSYSIWNSPK